jgi:ADP-ribosylglycohydrolase
MVLASFAADSHALGAHWIYDMKEIASRYGRVERLLPPPPDSLHAGRPKGSFTHYGDQALILLRHLAARKAFDPNTFADQWRATMRSAVGYIDPESVETLSNLEAGAKPIDAGSHSTNISAAARIAPLAYLLRDEYDELASAAALYARMTHNSAPVIATASFLARALWNVLNGKTPGAALRTVLQASSEPEIAGLVESGLDSIERDTAEAALAFGQGGGIASALPLTVHLIAKYEGSLKEALVENVAMGGDSAARGMIVGMMLGAFHGHDAIPDGWIREMVAYREISALLEDLEAILQRATSESAHAP